tara:strand:- start:84 stop:347 length:264 start_codon:yes stop_codon:yes gene_type:complete
MYRLLNTFLILIITIFLFNVSKYYFSNKNIYNSNYNRSNIDIIIKDKIADLPILINDTNNVIEFNNSFEEEIKIEKKRSFWDLLKTK